MACFDSSGYFLSQYFGCVIYNENHASVSPYRKCLKCSITLIVEIISCDLHVFQRNYPAENLLLALSRLKYKICLYFKNSLSPQGLFSHVKILQVEKE